MIVIPVSLGELVDKLTILSIKKKCTEGHQRRTVEKEEKALKEAFEKLKLNIDQKYWQELEAINQKLWSCEDRLRELEAEEKFDDEFVSFARSVYLTNDERAKIKRTINQIYQSDLEEVKVLPSAYLKKMSR
jgi:DNA-binding SARP family transcriptional activator